MRRNAQRVGMCSLIAGRVYRQMTQVNKVCNAVIRNNFSKGSKVPRRLNFTQLPYHVDNPECAKEVVQYLQKHIDLHNQNTVILDCFPGRGMLVEALLVRGARNVIAWDKTKDYANQIEELIMKHREKLVYTQEVPNFNALLPEHFKNDDEESPLKVFGSASTDAMSKYIVVLSYKLCTQFQFYSMGNVPLYMFVPHMEIQIIRDAQVYWEKTPFVRSAFYEVFFESKTLIKIPVVGFTPNKVKRYKKRIVDTEHLYLIKLMPKKSTVKDIPNPELLISLLLELSTRKKTALLDLMDNWCPNSRSRLVSAGYTTSDTVGRVSLCSWPNIYKILVSSPDYPGSILETLLHERSAVSEYQSL